MKKNLLFLFLTCALLFSCAKDSPDVSGGWKNEEEKAAVINPNYVSVDWDKTKVKNYNSKDQTFTLQLTSETEKIKKGSVLSILADTAGCITIVNSVKRSGGDVEIKGIQGALCDIFANTNFYLSTGADQKETKATGVTVYYPQKIIFEDNKTHSLKSEKYTRGSKWTDKLWDWVAPISYGLKLYNALGSKIEIKESRFSADLNLDVYFSFGERTLKATKEEAYRQYRSGDLAMEAVLNGDINIINTIQEEIHANANIEQETKLMESMFKPVRLVFYPGGVPVVVSMSADLMCGVNGKVSGKQIVNFDVNTKISGKYGLTWSQSSKGLQRINYLQVTNELNNANVKNIGSIEVKASLWPRIFLTFYEVAAATFDIKPYYSASLSGGYNVGEFANGSSGKNGGSAYSFSLNAGVDGAVGLSPMIFSHELYNYNLAAVNLLNYEIFKSPSGMQVLHPTEKEFDLGSVNKVQVMVYDKFLYGEPMPSIIPQLVIFEGDGTLSANYAITSNGIATVDWTPSKYSDKLKATLYNGTGGIIKQVVINGNAEVGPPTSGDLIDLGLSVKWASHNVGASSPEERGKLFAWGEASSKSSFSIANYKYYNPKEGHEYPGLLYQSDFDFPNSPICNTSNDAAKMNMGGKYRMPTRKEMAELLDKCEKALVTYKGKKGLMLTGPNGNRIFLPTGCAPGYFAENLNDEFEVDDISLAYWTGNLCYTYWPTAYGIDISWYDANPPYYVRDLNTCGGSCVRAVGN